MVRILTIILILLSTNAYAERWVCQEGNNLRRLEGDGVKLGISGINNTSIVSNCIEATEQEWIDANNKNKKLDKSVTSSSRIVNISQDEIDSIEADKLARITARINNIRNLKLKLKELGLTNEEINYLLDSN